jgi:hypothetical protein
VPFLIAAGTTGTPAIVFRVLLIGVVLLLTSATSTHAVVHAAHILGERLGTRGADDDSGPDAPPPVGERVRPPQ